MQYNLIETETDSAFLKKSTDLLEEQIGSALSKTGHCTIGLSGGSTPLPVYEELAKRPLDWTNVTIFLIDDRYVAADHPDSNQRVIRETLITPIGLPAGQFIAPDTAKPLDECVHAYEQALKDLLARNKPEIIVLGLGEDGHIGSLFPPVPEEAFEPSRLALATHTDRFPVAERITVTFPVLQESESFLLLLRGRLKKHVWSTMLEADMDPKTWPAQTILGTGRCSVITQWIVKGEADA